MAQATTIKFGLQQLLIGSGATPEIFSAPCGITTLTKTTNVETNTVNIPDCTDPDLASFLGIDEVSRQIQLAFGGVLATESLPMWQAWDLAGGYKNIRWYRNLSNPNGGGYLQGSALLTAFEETAEAKGRYNMSGTVIFDGKPTWVAA
jgi:hypothetical protein